VIGRRWPPMGGFRSEPGLPVVRALEDFDDVTQTAIKAPVFVRRVLSPRQPVTATERPEDALALCLDERGSVDVETIGPLLGCDFSRGQGPARHVWSSTIPRRPPVPAAVYLSGHVPLEVTGRPSRAGEQGEMWQTNVTALEAVQPRDLEPGEIGRPPCVPWIPPSDIKAFCAEVWMPGT